MAIGKQNYGRVGVHLHKSSISCVDLKGFFWKEEEEEEKEKKIVALSGSGETKDGERGCASCLLL